MVVPYFGAGAAGAGAAGAPGAAPAAPGLAAFLSPECPWKVRVGANSPSLWPTMFSVTKTGTNLRPLCTAKVRPTASGTMVERRDQVLMTFFELVALAAWIFSIRWPSTNGPFLMLRGMAQPFVPRRRM